MPTGYIYQIINTSNFHSYIGYTNNFISRMNRHYNCRGNSLIYRAFRKHGVDNFIVRILEQPLIQNLPEREKYWINFFDTYQNGYNMTPGGDGGPTTRGKKRNRIVFKQNKK